MKKNRFFNTLTLLIVSVVGFAILLGLLYTGIIDEYYGQLLILSLIYAIVSLSLNLITGFAGQLALGQAGFMAIGAYTTAIAVKDHGVPIITAILLGGVLTAIFGMIIGFPTLRLRGDYLAITTLGFGEIIRVMLENLEGLTGGAAGLKDIPKFSNSGDLLKDSLVSFSWVYIFFILTLIIITNLLRSSHGRAIISIREDEIAANSMGINVAYSKMFAFTMAAFFSGIGGGLYSLYFGYLSPKLFGFMSSVNFVIIIVLGGLGSMTGTVIASVIFIYIREWLDAFGDLRLVIFALTLILIMLFWQRGIMGTSEFSFVGFTRKLLKGEYTPSKIAASIRRAFKRKNKASEVK